MFTKSIACAAAFAVMTTSAFAGGLADAIVESTVPLEQPAAGPTASINPTYILLGILAVLVVASTIDGDETEELPEEECEKFCEDR